MQIKIGQGLALLDNSKSSGQRFEEPHKLGLTFYDDLLASIRQQRCVADELHAVSKTLLGVKQERSIFQRAAVPLWLGKSARFGRRVFAFPSPLVLFPTP
jgi:hypothetical protein